MSNKKQKRALSTQEDTSLQGDHSYNGHVVYFSKPNYEGMEEGWSASSAIKDKLDGSGIIGETYDLTQFWHNFGSMIVLRGEVETTTGMNANFNVGTQHYYFANKGINNQGCYPTLQSGDTDNVSALRVNDSNPVRNTTIPYLVLRDGTGFNENTKVQIVTEDKADMAAFPAEMFISVGSPTGKWYLYDESNYNGYCKILKVDGGDIDHGIYYDREAFTVRSARMEDPDYTDYEILVTTGTDTGDDTKNDIAMQLKTSTTTSSSFGIDIAHNSKGDMAITNIEDLKLTGEIVATILSTDGKDAWSCDHQWVTDLETGRAGYAPQSAWVENGSKETPLKYYESRKEHHEIEAYTFKITLDQDLNVYESGSEAFKLFDEYGNATPLTDIYIYPYEDHYTYTLKSDIPLRGPVSHLLFYSSGKFSAQNIVIETEHGVVTKFDNFSIDHTHGWVWRDTTTVTPVPTPTPTLPPTPTPTPTPTPAPDTYAVTAYANTQYTGTKYGASPDIGEAVFFNFVSINSLDFSEPHFYSVTLSYPTANGSSSLLILNTGNIFSIPDLIDYVKKEFRVVTDTLALFQIARIS